MRALVRAPAKLTLRLRVLGVRPDGLHSIDAEMVSIDLADELTIERADRTELHIGGTAARGVVGGPRNLVTRALQAVGVDAVVRLQKRIPAGGGLGGGSSDAAAVLRWAGCSELSVALGLGSDVPYCVVGGRAKVQGTGESVQPLDFEERSFTLLTPPLHVSTPSVYGAWDDLGGPTGEGENDLEAAALRVEPGLQAWRDRLGDATGQTPQLAGSGSTWFVEGAFPDVKAPGAHVHVARTVPAGWGD
ncbi:MAG TPA: 4-(cytidine 5'-diphospho)-2-C-methyl-D-erythritol kinase [Acidimicrobiales bacterium]|nr:4-(cytidine 5'-diphospho)-2-C-methyl-D-erythritol kinase [Acidimicrobiales bacterium]